MPSRMRSWINRSRSGSALPPAERTGRRPVYPPADSFRAVFFLATANPMAMINPKIRCKPPNPVARKAVPHDSGQNSATAPRNMKHKPHHRYYAHRESSASDNARAVEQQPGSGDRPCESGAVQNEREQRSHHQMAVRS